MEYSTLPLFSLQPETKEIPLTQGKVAIVDASDYDWLMQWSWCTYKNKHTWYVTRQCALPNGKSQNVFMHREILRAPSNVKVDHRDGNGLNNCRKNLRFATNQQNSFNQRVRSDNTSGYKGVVWHKQHQRWYAQIRIGTKSHHLGYFETAIEAARAFDAAARKMHGEFARLNFPEGD